MCLPCAGDWMRLCSLDLGLLLPVMTPSQHLSPPCFPLTCFKNNYSVSMHADISILQFVLQLLAKFSHPFFDDFVVRPFLLKVPGGYCPIISVGEREGWRSLNKVCAWEGRETGMDIERKQDERKLSKLFSHRRWHFCGFCFLLYAFTSILQISFQRATYTLIKKNLLMNIIFSDEEKSQWASKSALVISHYKQAWAGKWKEYIYMVFLIILFMWNQSWLHKHIQKCLLSCVTVNLEQWLLWIATRVQLAPCIYLDVNNKFMFIKFEVGNWGNISESSFTLIAIEQQSGF